MKKIVIWMGVMLFLLCLIPGITFASIIYGTPVAPDGTPVTGDVVDNEIFYYIPLTEATSGDYDDRGSTSDTASAPTSGWLNMYIKFGDIDPAITHADIKFNFVDLDLDPDNDPDALHESVQFFLWNEDTQMDIQPLTGEITNADNNPDPTVISISGNNDSRDIVFEDFELATVDSLIFRLFFKSVITGDKTWYNTEESLTASLNKSAVPEPTAILLLGTGLLGIVGFRRKMKK